MKHKQSGEKVHENQFAARTREKVLGHFNKANRIPMFFFNWRRLQVTRLCGVRLP